MEYVQKSVDIADRITRKEKVDGPCYNGYIWSMDYESWTNRFILGGLIIVICIFIWSDVYGTRTCNNCDDSVGPLFVDVCDNYYCKRNHIPQINRFESKKNNHTDDDVEDEFGI